MPCKLFICIYSMLFWLFKVNSIVCWFNNVPINSKQKVYIGRKMNFKKKIKKIIIIRVTSFMSKNLNSGVTARIQYFQIYIFLFLF